MSTDPTTATLPAASGTSGASSAADGGNAALKRRWSEALMPTLGTPATGLVSGRGATVTDADGTVYTDLLSGVSVNALGHAHPAIVEAVTAQIGTLGHVSNLFSSEPAVALAEKLIEVAGIGGRVFFANSGAEANEAAFKIARRTGRPQIIALEGAFHGRTMGALALTGQPGKQDGFHPMPGGVTHLPFGDLDALRAAVSAETAAVVIEPIQGEYGVRPLPDGYLKAAREITAEHGALLILDEVQTGTGRTGHWFAFQAADQLGHDPAYAPDVVTLAKGIGGGLPLGACLAFGEAADLLAPGQHASTFGGNPVCTAAGLAVLTTIENDGLLERVRTLGERIAEAVTGLGHPAVSRVRGRGLLLGLVLNVPAAEVVAEAQRSGYLLNAVAANVIRLAPPLIISDAQVDAFLADLPGILDRASAAAA